MKVGVLLVSATLCAVAKGSVLSVKCDHQVVRKEYRDLSKKEWDNFHNAFMSLQNVASPDKHPGWTEWDWWTRMHIDNMMTAHGTNLFFPWHRAYVAALERRLQRINKDIVIPFWDWTFDWEHPLTSPIFSSDYGFVVAVGKDPNCTYPRQLFERHCLIRDYNASNFPSYYPPSSISSVIGSEGNYTQFRQLIEMVPHAIVHTSLGGKKGDMNQMNSPNDPIFFLHHSMIDYIWYIWQHVGGHGTTFDGNLNQVLTPFGVTVKDVIDSSKLCISYQPFSRNRALIPSSVSK
jgi:tyrosinase